MIVINNPPRYDKNDINVDIEYEWILKNVES